MKEVKCLKCAEVMTHRIGPSFDGFSYREMHYYRCKKCNELYFSEVVEQ